MSWISLICLFAVASAACGRYASDAGYGDSSSITIDQSPRLLRTSVPFPEPIQVSSSYGQRALVSPPRSSYNSDVITTRVETGYGGEVAPKVTQPLVFPPATDSYGRQITTRVITPRVESGYGEVTPKVTQPLVFPPATDNYGRQTTTRVITPRVEPGYGEVATKVTQPLVFPPATDSYGRQTMTRVITPRVETPYGGYGSQLVTKVAPATDSYGRETMTRVISPPTFPRFNYGGYGGETATRMITPRVNTGYATQPATRIIITPPAVFPVTQNYGGYSSSVSSREFTGPLLPAVQPMTPADLLCKDQAPETVIPIDNNRRFVVCIDTGKGVVQECPKGLVYHTESRRCERKLGPFENACASQPCMNGGQCFPTDSLYKCQCAPGFDGDTCELDARVCQTQQPCGQSPDTRCQSFRFGAALSHMCIFEDGGSYGFRAGEASRNPCQGISGPQALAISNQGFILCDTDRMFVESCPGGTIWDDVFKACSWPDQQVVPVTRSSLRTEFVQPSNPTYSTYTAPAPTVSAY